MAEKWEPNLCGNCLIVNYLEHHKCYINVEEFMGAPNWKLWTASAVHNNAMQAEVTALVTISRYF